ncbi:iron-siderophore ABC transporter substrate-binding protein [Paenibacillus cisolokensis]|uniref:ABC transporter substrate-binding protein n=1 Tax=Paenibacillus cisolokensis TaxID=1658519 RepID=UPI003D2E08A5
MRNAKSLVLILFMFAVVLAGCGGGAGGTSPAANSGANESAANAGETGQGGDNANNSPQTRKFEHALGETEITGVPERIVALEWVYAEDVLALGVQPVGIADIEGMNKWVNIPVEIGPEVTDIGLRQEPNLEIIASLKPDLIIGVKSTAEANYDALKSIAPTLIFDPYPGEGEGDQYDEMINTFKTIADAIGKQEEAEQVLSSLEETYADAKAKLEAAGMTERPIVLAMGYSNQNAVTFRISTDNALAIKTLEHIGLTNAYKANQFEIYGFTTTDVEALPALQDANFLHIIQETDNIIDNQLKDNPVWKGLNFVKEDRVYALGGDMWPYGGPLSAQLMAQKTADLLAQ